jgi:hypothetical protein
MPTTTLTSFYKASYLYHITSRRPKACEISFTCTRPEIYFDIKSVLQAGFQSLCLLGVLADLGGFRLLHYLSFASGFCHRKVKLAPFGQIMPIQFHLSFSQRLTRQQLVPESGNTSLRTTHFLVHCLIIIVTLRACWAVWELIASLQPMPLTLWKIPKAVRA